MLIAESAHDLRRSLHAMNQYCCMWNLSVNVSKTKVVIFSRGKVRKYPKFSLGGNNIEVVDDYMYLGVKMHYNGRYATALKENYGRASRAMFTMLCKARKLLLPVDIQLKLFDSVVVPVLLYGAEIWCFEACNIIEKLHLRFCKMILKVNKSTCSNMVYGELGRFPLNIDIKLRAISFWARLISSGHDKLSGVLYNSLYQMHVQGLFTSKWVNYVSNVLNECGFSGVWQTQQIPGSTDWFKQTLRLRLKDQFQQKWHSEVNNSVKCSNYRTFKSKLNLEPYLMQLPTCYKYAMTKFRCRNHSLPIEVGRSVNLDRDERFCMFCNNRKVGDEFHYIFECVRFVDERRRYLKEYYWKKPNVLKFEELMNNPRRKIIANVAKFIKYILATV